MLAFAELGLSPALLRSVQAQGFHTPTPVQEQTIAAALNGRDVRASAQTGSGKTAAFVLPLLQLGKPALVLAPTREIALQIGDVVKQLGRCKCVVAVGGVPVESQSLALSDGADIIVATPGRLLDLVERQSVWLRRISIVVLDEADRLLSLGFGDQLRAVFAQLPKQRQTLLFSATMPAKVLTLADEIMRQPIIVNIDAGGVPRGLRQRAIEVDESQRTRLLKQLLATESWNNVLVFVASREAADKLQQALPRSVALHGELGQEARTKALADFKAGRVSILIATDLAARGIDVPLLSAVVNYDLPRSPHDYVHRVGRTSRAGHAGESVSFVFAANAAHFRLIEKRNRLQVPRERVRGLEPKSMEPPPGDPHGGKKGKRKSKKDKLREAKATS